MAVALVAAMSCMRSWLRSSYLGDVFTLDQLAVVSQYSPLIFFYHAARWSHLYCLDVEKDCPGPALVWPGSAGVQKQGAPLAFTLHEGQMIHQHGQGVCITLLRLTGFL